MDFASDTVHSETTAACRTEIAREQSGSPAYELAKKISKSRRIRCAFELARSVEFAPRLRSRAIAFRKPKSVCVRDELSWSLLEDHVLEVASVISTNMN